jgi:hypothetical protein
MPRTASDDEILEVASKEVLGPIPWSEEWWQRRLPWRLRIRVWLLGVRLWLSRSWYAPDLMLAYYRGEIDT